MAYAISQKTQEPGLRFKFSTTQLQSSGPFCKYLMVLLKATWAQVT